MTKQIKCHETVFYDDTQYTLEDANEYLGYDKNILYSEDYLYAIISCMNNDDFDSFTQMIVDSKLHNEQVVCIADVGTWHGRRTGYKLLTDLRCVAEVMSGYNRLYHNGKTLCVDACHHDGTNYVKLYTWAKGLSDEQKDKFLDKVYNGTFTKNDLYRYVRCIKLKDLEEDNHD